MGMSVKTQCVWLNHFAAETESAPVKKEGPSPSVPVQYVRVRRTRRVCRRRSSSPGVTEPSCVSDVLSSLMKPPAVLLRPAKPRISASDRRSLHLLVIGSPVTVARACVCVPLVYSARPPKCANACGKQRILYQLSCEGSQVPQF